MSSLCFLLRVYSVCVLARRRLGRFGSPARKLQAHWKAALCARVADGRLGATRVGRLTTRKHGVLRRPGSCTMQRGAHVLLRRALTASHAGDGRTSRGMGDRCLRTSWPKSWTAAGAVMESILDGVLPQDVARCRAVALTRSAWIDALCGAQAHGVQVVHGGGQQPVVRAGGGVGHFHFGPEVLLEAGRCWTQYYTAARRVSVRAQGESHNRCPPRVDLVELTPGVDPPS